MTPSIEERTAVLENIAQRNEKDKNELFKIFREHMDQEEKDRITTLGLISGVEKKVDTMKAYFLGGAGALSVVWAITTFFIKGAGS